MFLDLKNTRSCERIGQGPNPGRDMSVSRGEGEGAERRARSWALPASGEVLRKVRGVLEEQKV